MTSKNDARVLWLVAGAAVGAGVALLYAPQSGEDTRKYLRKKAEQAKDKLADAGEEVADKGRALYKKGAKVVESAGEMLERGRKWVTA